MKTNGGSIHMPTPARTAGWIAALAAALVLSTPGPARTDDLQWPRRFDTPSGLFVVYQPQPETLEGDRLTGRAAFSLEKTEGAVPAFGVLWYAERIEIDRDSSTVTARSFDVTKVRLPGITPEEAARYEDLVETEAARWDWSGSLDELRAGLAAAEKERASVAGLQNTPPHIIFHERRAILVVYDGAPVLGPIEESDLQRVVNTPFAVLLDLDDGFYYLNGANLWYRARDPLGPWTKTSRPPIAVRAAVPPDTSSFDQVQGTAPDVITAVEPTELIATNGPPQYEPLVGDELLYIANTESDVILDVSTQYLYVLLSGRWFRAPSTDGPWTFVRGDQLPASFKLVPPDSPKGNILASVAGTEQAEDAIADAEIPQTSAIRRDDQSFQATYDGDPQFVPIEGTDLGYAVNTGAQVILADGRYYACDQGVWYIADDPLGPWSVSETRPLGVEDIPPSCPVYDVRYVYIYDWTPDVVYVGYLPGYLGWYPYYGTVVYGTGYSYVPWRTRHRYYPRRFTWGFYARYNPWLARWSFGYSYATGFYRVGARWHPDGPVTRPRTRVMWFGPGGYNRPLIQRDLTMVRTRTTVHRRSRLPEGVPMNVYNRSENIVRVERSVVSSPNSKIAPAVAPKAPVPNDVFAGKDGQVYRREPEGTWQVRTGTEWKPAELPPPPPPTAPPPGERQRGSEGGTSTQGGSGGSGGGPLVEVPIPRQETPSTRQTQPPAKPTPPPEKPKAQERPTPTHEEKPQPPARQEKPQQQARQEKPQQQARQEKPQQQARQEKPAPPPNRPSPGDLEREFRARQRSGQEDKQGAPPPSARPAPKDKQEKAEPKGQKPSKEKPSQSNR